MSSIDEILGLLLPSDSDRKLINIHYGFVRALVHKLIEKNIITEADAIEILEESKKEWNKEK